MGCCCCCIDPYEDTDLQIYKDKCLQYFQKFQTFIYDHNNQLIVTLQKMIKTLKSQKKQILPFIDSQFQKFAQDIRVQIEKIIIRIKSTAKSLFLQKQQKSRQQSEMSRQFTVNQNYVSQKGDIQNLKSSINQSIAEQREQRMDLVKQISNPYSNNQRSLKNSNRKSQNKKKAISSMGQPFLKEKNELYFYEKSPIINSNKIINNKKPDEISAKNNMSYQKSSVNSFQKQIMNFDGEYIKSDEMKKLKKQYQSLQQKLNKTDLQLKKTLQKLKQTQCQLQEKIKFIDVSLNSIQRASLNRTIDSTKDQAKLQKQKQELQNKLKLVQQLQKTLKKQFQTQKTSHMFSKDQIKRQKHTIQMLNIQIQQLKQQKLDKQLIQKLDKELIQKKPMVFSKHNKSFQMQTSFISSSSDSHTQEMFQPTNSQQYQVQTSFIESDKSKRSSTRKSIIIRLFKQSKILESNYNKSLLQAIQVRQNIQNMFATFFCENYFDKQSITQTNILFSFDKINPNKYNQYINGKNNLFLIAKLNQNTIFGGFIRYINGLTQSTKQSFLYSITKGCLPYILKPFKEVRPINTNPQYINFGDNQLRIKSKTRQCTVNIGCMGCQYKTQDGKVSDNYLFLKSNQKKFQVQDYQIYELVFQKSQY